MESRYFVADIEDAVRIAVVYAENDDCWGEIPETSGEEINEADLPRDFQDWKRYTAHSYLYGYVEVLSRDGE